MTVETTMPAAEARASFADLLGRVFYGGERVVITRQKRRCVAMVSVEDLELLEQLEDLGVAELAREAIAAHQAGDGKRLSLRDVFGETS